MSEMYNRIEELCKNHGVNVTQMCRDCGANRAALSDLKMGRNKTLSAETLSLIGAYFGVTVEYLLGKGEPSEAKTPAVELLQSLRDEERMLLQVTKTLTPAQIKIMMEFGKQMKGTSDNAD